MGKYLEYIIAFLVTISLLFTIGIVILFRSIDSALGLNDKVYSVSELKFEYLKNEKEIEELIKKWLPYLKVIEPLSLDEKIKSDIKKYLI